MTDNKFKVYSEEEKYYILKKYNEGTSVRNIRAGLMEEFGIERPYCGLRQKIYNLTAPRKRKYDSNMSLSNGNGESNIHELNGSPVLENKTDMVVGNINFFFKERHLLITKNGIEISINY